MEDILKAIILGIIQGITEFLPISSTAHLRIIPVFFGWGDIGAAYTAVIQIGTMIAILLYFRNDISKMLNSLFNSFKNKDLSNYHFKLFVNISIGTIPILILGYLLKNLIRNQFRSIYLISIVIITFSLIIYATDKFCKKVKKINNISYFDALVIGFFQALALIPGVSRSGSSISGSFFRNVERESAARFSFLLSIPAILISGIYELFSERKVLFESEGPISLLIATCVSGIVGYYSIWFLLEYLKKHGMMLFVIYRILFGFLILILLYFNIIK